MLKILITVAVVLACVGAWVITRPAVPKSLVPGYQDALEQFPGTTESIAQGLKDFETAYQNLADEHLADRVHSLYAENLYFNDTLHTFTTREQLAGYMGATSESLNSSSIRIDQIMQDGGDVWVRWTMHFESSAGGRIIQSDSIGMSHLRFNEKGQIVLHQDFWDAASGLYRNLPVVGYILDQADRRLPK